MFRLVGETCHATEHLPPAKGHLHACAHLNATGEFRRDEVIELLAQGDLECHVRDHANSVRRRADCVESKQLTAHTLDDLPRVSYNSRVKGRWIWIILVLLALDIAVFLWWRIQQRENAFDAQIQQAANAYGVAPELVKAVVWRESRFNPDARGSSGEYGLMQIQETAANEWAAAVKNNDFKPEHLLNPKTNLLAGTWYLSKWSNRSPH